MRNATLTNIDGLASLRFIGSAKDVGRLDISGNKSLQNLDGLSSLS
jgi:hypothetical protein